MTDPADHPARLTKASDLPPEISTLIETAIAQEAGLAPRRRPVVATRFQAVQDTPLRLPHLKVPEKGTRVLALEDLVLISLFVGLLLTAWVSLLIGINMAQAAERTTTTCIVRAEAPAAHPSVLDRGSCGRLLRRN